MRFTATLLAVILFNTVVSDGRTEMMGVGPFKPKLTLYGVAFEPAVDVMVDVSTQSGGAHVRTDTRAAIDAASIPAKLKRIVEPLLTRERWPVASCTFRAESIRELEFKVIGNTADFRITAPVTSDCPVWGDVSVTMRLVPAVEKSQLTVRLAEVSAKVPGAWTFLGAFAGKSPRKEIEQKVRDQFKDKSLALPVPKGGSSAFQGASLDTKGRDVILRVRADAVIPKGTVTELLLSFDQVKNFTYAYPEEE